METIEVVASSPTYEVARRHPRFLLSFPVSLTRMGEPGQPVTHGLSLDLSRGGTSAVLYSQPAVGETVRLSLEILGAPLETLAIVRHSNSTHSGFEFLELLPAQQQQLGETIHAMEGRSWPWQPDSAAPTSMPSTRVLGNYWRNGS
jgi:PilZ domain